MSQNDSLLKDKSERAVAHFQTRTNVLYSRYNPFTFYAMEPPLVSKYHGHSERRPAEDLDLTTIRSSVGLIDSKILKM